jgi:hypothetical protein
VISAPAGEGNLFYADIAICLPACKEKEEKLFGSEG